MNVFIRETENLNPSIVKLLNALSISKTRLVSSLLIEKREPSEFINCPLLEIKIDLVTRREPAGNGSNLDIAIANPSRSKSCTAINKISNPIPAHAVAALFIGLVIVSEIRKFTSFGPSLLLACLLSISTGTISVSSELAWKFAEI